MAKTKRQSRIVLTKRGFERQFNFGDGWKTEAIALVNWNDENINKSTVYFKGVQDLLNGVTHHLYLGCEFIGFFDESGLEVE